VKRVTDKVHTQTEAGKCIQNFHINRREFHRLSASIFAICSLHLNIRKRNNDVTCLRFRNNSAFKTPCTNNIAFVRRLFTSQAKNRNDVIPSRMRVSGQRRPISEMRTLCIVAPPSWIPLFFYFWSILLFNASGFMLSRNFVL
jgi:hypothetical protein